MRRLWAVLLFVQACVAGSATAGRQMPVWPDVPDHDHPPVKPSVSTPATEEDTDSASGENAPSTPGLPPPPASLAAVGNDVAATLADKSFAFCHEEDYPLLSHERDFCPLVKKGDPRCPAFAAACAEVESPPPRSCHDDEPVRATAGSPLVGGALRTLYYLFIVVGIGVVLWLVLRYAIPDAVEEDTIEATPTDAPASPTTDERTVVETDVSRLLARAQAHARSGAFRQAIHDLHAALIRRLEGYRLIRVHPSRTNGDFLRDLAGRDELRGEVGTILSDVDRLEFGAATPDAPAYESLLGKVMTFVSRPLILLLLVAGASGLWACGLMKRGDHLTVPSGHGAFVKLLEHSGYTATFRVENMEHFRWDGAKQFVLLPGAPRMPDGTVRELLDFVQEGGSLIVVGTSDAPSQLLEAAGVRGGVLNTAQQIVFPPGALPKDRVPPPAARLPPGENLTLDAAKAKQRGVATTLQRGTHPYAVTRAYDKQGRLVVLADDHLFTNLGLLVGDNAATVLHLFAEHGEKIEVLSRLTGTIATNPAQALSKAGLTAFLFHLLALVALFILWKGIPFGTPRDTETVHRRAFAEHVRSLGLHYARAKASRWVLAAYGTYVFDRLRERLRLHGQQGFSRMTQALALRSGKDQGSIGRLLAETLDAKEHPTMESHSPEAIQSNLALMRELSDLLGTPEHLPAKKRKEDTP